MQTPNGAQEMPGEVPDTTPPPTTSKSKRKKGDRTDDHPSTDPTRLRSANGQPPSSLKKRRSRADASPRKTPAFANPLDIDGQSSAANQNSDWGLTSGSNPAVLDQTQSSSDNNALLVSSSGQNDGEETWGDRRSGIRNSRFNTIVVRYPERALLVLVLLPCILGIILFAVNWSDSSARSTVSRTPLGIDVVRDGASALQSLLREQYLAEDLQHFHVTAAQQATLQSQAGVYYPFYPEISTPNYYQASVNYVDAVSDTDTLRKALWVSYLAVKDDLATDTDVHQELDAAFDEVLLEKTRLQVRSGYMEKSDAAYTQVMAGLLRFLQRLWFLGGTAPAWQDTSLPLRVAGLVGRSAALEAIALTLKQGAQLDGNASTLLIDGSSAGVEAFLHESALAEAYRVRIVTGFTPEEHLNVGLTETTEAFLENSETSLSHTALSSTTWTGSSSSLRSVASEMLSLLEISSSSSFTKMKQLGSEARIIESTWSLLLVVVVLSCTCLFGMVFLVLSATKNKAQDKEIRDMEKAMDRMKLFVKKVSDFDIAPLNSKVPRSAPQQELMLRQYMTPMKELVDFIPGTLTYPPLSIPPSHLTPEGLWLKSDQFFHVPSLAVVRIDTTAFHSQFHSAGSKQRTVQHQSQAVLSSIHAIVAAYDVQLNVLTDHVMCYINLCDEVPDPAIVALSIGFQVRQMCSEQKLPMLRCSIAIGSAFIGMATTKTQHSESHGAGITHLAVTGTVIAETECLCSASHIHNVDLITTERVMALAKDSSQSGDNSHMDLFATYNPSHSVMETNRQEVPVLYKEDVEYRPLEVLRLDPRDGFAIEQPHRGKKKVLPVDNLTTVLYEISSSKLSTVRSSIAGASTDRNPMVIEWKVAFQAFGVATESKENMLNALGLLMEFEARYPKDPSALRLLSILVRIHEANEEGGNRPFADTTSMQSLTTSQDELRQHAVLGYMCNNSSS